jgi:hypothetical protein
MSSSHRIPAPLAPHRGPSGLYLGLLDQDLLEALDLNAVGLTGHEAASGVNDQDGIWDRWSDHWATRPKPAYYVNPQTYALRVLEQLPELASVLIDRADEVFHPDFAHKTYRPRRAGRTFQWVDQVNDSAYCGFHYMWFIKEFGRAFLLTGDQKYPAMLREIVCSWVDALPELALHASYQGAQANENTGSRLIWNSGLGSSVRCLGMLDGYFLMRQSSEFTPELHRKLLAAFLGHSRYLFDNHMQTYSPSNFQATATCWLVTAGTMLPEFHESGRWLEAAAERLKERICRNFEPDGAQVEQCPQYHLAGMRDILRPLLLLELNGRSEISGDRELWRKLERIFDYPARIAHSTGHLGLFNSGVYGTEWQAFLPLGWRLFGSRLQGWAASRFIADGFVPVAKDVSQYIALMDGDWLAALSASRQQALAPPAQLDQLLDSSGVAVIRSGWDRASHSLVFDCNRKPWGGHAYPARLSFDLFANGVALVTNPGSPMSYSLPEYRGWCHRTLSHNTVLVDGRCQGKPHTAAVEAWSSSERVTFISASTSTYEKSAGVSHQRCLVAVRGEYYLIVDWLRGGADGTPLSWLLHSPQQIEPLTDGTVASPAGKPGMRVVPDSLTTEHAALSMGTGHGAVPVEYGDGYRHTDAWRDDVACMSLESSIDGGLGGQAFAVVIVPFASDMPEVTAITDSTRASRSMCAYGVSVRRGKVTDRICVRVAAGRTMCEIARTDADGREAWSDASA